MTVFRSLTSVAALAALLAMLAGPAAAPTAAQADRPAGLSVLATNAIVGPLTAIVEEHERRTGQKLAVEFDTSPSINRRFAAGTLSGVHVLVAAAGTVDQAVKEKKAIADTRVRVGRVGVGVAVRPGARKPDLSSVEALKASLLAADAVVYSQGASGVYVAQLLDKLGLAAQMKGKAVQVTTGADMIERVQKSRGNEIGMTQISEIVRAVEEHPGAVEYVGPLPAAVQNYTLFDAVVMTGAPEAARGFVRGLSGPAARKLLADNEWEF